MRFVGKAAAGRGVSDEELEQHARGRIWTGAQAVELGLADRTGTLDDAVEEAARRAGLRKVILPEKNRKDLVEIPDNVKKMMDFYFVSTMDEVLDLALKKKKTKKNKSKSKSKKRIPIVKDKEATA